MEKREKIKNVFGTVSSFLTTFIVTVIVVVAAALVVLHFTGIQFFTVESGSMEPEYPVNSLVFVKETPPEQIKEGDVITYIMNAHGTLVTHRVAMVNAEEETFITKGDANSSQDPNPVLWGNVVGKVVFSLPKVGSVFRVVTSDEARPYIIAAVVVLGVVSVAGDIMDKRRKKREKISADAQKEQETAADK